MIRQIRNKVELTAALSLIWETFLQFEAPDYSDEGVKSFRDFIENEDIVASLEPGAGLSERVNQVGKERPGKRAVYVGLLRD